MAVRISDVARKAGVGYGTASRALSGQGYVSPQTREHILKVARELKYQPNRVARSLASGRSEYVAFFSMPGILSSNDRLLISVDRRLRNEGYRLVLHTFSGSRQSEIEGLNELVQRRVAGVIAAPGLDSPPKPYRQLLDHGVKVVVIDRYVRGLEVPHVIVDHYRANLLATRYLISLGHKQIAYMAIPPTSYIGSERLRGYKDALTEAGIEIDESLILPTEASTESGEKTMARLLRRKQRPTAVLTRHDYVAVGAMKAAFAAGLCVPKDISIASYGDIELVDMLRVPLTTAHPATEDMANLAVDTLLEALSGEPVEPKVTCVGVELIIRDSCAPPSS